MTESVEVHDDTGETDGIIPVRIVNPAISESGGKAPERSSFTTYDITPGSIVRLVARNARRSNCVITVNNSRSAVASVVDSTTPLAANASYMSPIIPNNSSNGSFIIDAASDQSGSIYIQGSDDGNTFYSIGFTNYNNTGGRYVITNPTYRYYRYTAVNGGTAQTYFSIRHTATNPNSYVVIGNQNKVNNGQGAAYFVGASLSYNGEQAVWCASDPAGDALTVTVLDEWDRD